MTERLTLNAVEVAELLGVSEAHARRKIADGTIPSIRLGKRVLVHREVLERWLLDKASAATA